jgi:hypothetical protein
MTAARLVLLGILTLLLVPAASGLAATDTPATDDAAAASKTAVHLSKLATTGPKPEPVTPPKQEDITAAIHRGVQFLLDDQRPNGCWGGPENSKSMNIYAPPPGAHDAFRTGVTSLAIMALVEVEPQAAEDQREKVTTAIDHGEQWLVDHLEHLRRATPDALYNVWGHSYSIQALVKLHQRAAGNPDRQAKLKELAAGQADMLKRYSFVNGGWAYYDFLAGAQHPSDSAFSFCTATALIALHDAKSLGIEFPEILTQKAIHSILRQQYPDFSYAYGEYLRMMPMMPINRPGGSLGRSQVCNLALRMYGDERITDDVLKTWLDRLIAREGWLSLGRKRPIPHESFFQVAGYFYYYGHWYAAQCMDQLPAADRSNYQDQLAHIILPLQEKDGSWWDFPLYDYHQQYGTAMAVMTLVRCQKSTAPAAAEPLTTGR